MIKRVEQLLQVAKRTFRPRYLRNGVKDRMMNTVASCEQPIFNQKSNQERKTLTVSPKARDFEGPIFF